MFQYTYATLVDVSGQYNRVSRCHHPPDTKTGLLRPVTTFADGESPAALTRLYPRTIAKSLSESGFCDFQDVTQSCSSFNPDRTYAVGPLETCHSGFRRNPVLEFVNNFCLTFNISPLDSGFRRSDGSVSFNCVAPILIQTRWVPERLCNRPDSLSLYTQ